MNPENARDCECCWAESDECIIFDLTKKWLCPECYNHAENLIKKTSNLIFKDIETSEVYYKVLINCTWWDELKNKWL